MKEELRALITMMQRIARVASFATSSVSDLSDTEQAIFDYNMELPIGAQR
jgi:hypothetical protein